MLVPGTARICERRKERSSKPGGGRTGALVGVAALRVMGRDEPAETRGGLPSCVWVEQPPDLELAFCGKVELVADGGELAIEDGTELAVEPECPRAAVCGRRRLGIAWLRLMRLLLR